MARRLDDNLVITSQDGQQVIACAHCGQVIAGAGENYLARLARFEGPPTEAGPHNWADASVYIDKSVVFRQYYCPSCYTAFHTEIVPTDHPIEVDRQLAATA